MKDSIGFGIIGTGSISEWHAAGIEAHPDAELVAVSNRTKARAEEFAAKHSCDIASDWKNLVNRDDVEAVCVCTASGLHAEQSIAAMEAGKHVLVEKPMAINLRDAKAMIAVSKERGVKLGVIFQKRISRAVDRMKKAVSDGLFGDILYGDASIKWWRNQAYYNSGAWRGTWEMDGGGCTMNQGIHGIDLLLHIMCADVESIFAKYRTASHDIEVEDCTMALLTYENGAYGRLQTSTSVNPGQGNIIEINGTRGTAVLTDDAITTWAVSDSKEVPAVDTERETKTERSSSASDPTAHSTEGHERHVANFIAAIRGEEDLICSGDDGIKSLSLIIGLYESARRGEEVALNELLENK